MGYAKGEGIAIRVVEDDALTFRADVLALKYAQEHYGVDGAVAQCLDSRYANLVELMPNVNDSRFLDAAGTIGATAVLFVGVRRLGHFEYSSIREFSSGRPV